MIYNWKKHINSQKAEITAFAFNHFGATFINVMNGRKDEFTRNNCGWAHLRFTKVLNYTPHSDDNTKRSVSEYEHTYVYYTTSTTIDTTTNTSDKIIRNLNDVCFNVRTSVLDNTVLSTTVSNEFGHNNFIFLIDAGQYFFYMTKEDARQNVIQKKLYNGDEVYVIRTQGAAYKKTTETTLGPAQEVFYMDWDATYIQHVQYSKYRRRKGLIQVELYVDGQLMDVHVAKSTGEMKDWMESHGNTFSTEYYRLLANKGGSIKKDNKEFKFSRVTDSSTISIPNSSSSHSNSSSTNFPTLLGLSFSIQSNINLSENNDENNDEHLNNNIILNEYPNNNRAFVEEIMSEGDVQGINLFNLPEDWTPPEEFTYGHEEYEYVGTVDIDDVPHDDDTVEFFTPL